MKDATDDCVREQKSYTSIVSEIKVRNLDSINVEVRVGYCMKIAIIISVFVSLTTDSVTNLLRRVFVHFPEINQIRKTINLFCKLKLPRKTLQRVFFFFFNFSIRKMCCDNKNNFKKCVYECSLIVREMIRPGKLHWIKFIIIARYSIGGSAKNSRFFSSHRLKWRKKNIKQNHIWRRSFSWCLIRKLIQKVIFKHLSVGRQHFM